MKKKLKLTKRDIKKWVKALRSGEYKQTSNVLCYFAGDFDALYEDPNSEEGEYMFCCLGVACDLFLDTDWIHEGYQLSISNAVSMPPANLADAIDEALPSLANKFMTHEGCHSRNACEFLSTKNDEGKSFKQIANMIEHAAGLKK